MRREFTLRSCFPRRARLFESVGDSLHDWFDRGSDFVVPDSQHGISAIAEILSSAFVGVRLVGVVRTVEFDN